MAKNLNDRINRLEAEINPPERTPFFIGFSTQELKSDPDPLEIELGLKMVKRTPETDFGGVINLIRTDMSMGTEPEPKPIVQPNPQAPFWRRKNGFIEIFEPKPLNTGEEKNEEN